MTWSTEDLDAVGAAEELRISAVGSGSGGVPIWVVRVSDGLYVRSWKGTAGAWYRRVSADGAAHIQAGPVDRDVRVVPAPGVDEQVDRAYREKYGRYGSAYVGPMTSGGAHETTLRLVPA